MDKQQKVFNPDHVASECLSWIEAAVADTAGGIIDFPDLDEEWGKKLRKARREGVRDLRGWLADELYNDADTLQDLLGDHLHDLVDGNQEHFNTVLTVLERRSHPALKRACTELRKL